MGLSYGKTGERVNEGDDSGKGLMICDDWCEGVNEVG